ncbi:MAG: hypothetical protein FWE86_02420 [Oscillospiraceae bacterium]|nr:hypothetical protein [Oscillospiraceae bacterium]
MARGNENFKFGKNKYLEVTISENVKSCPPGPIEITVALDKTLKLDSGLFSLDYKHFTHKDADEQTLNGCKRISFDSEGLVKFTIDVSRPDKNTIKLTLRHKSGEEKEEIINFMVQPQPAGGEQPAGCPNGGTNSTVPVVVVGQGLPGTHNLYCSTCGHVLRNEPPTGAGVKTTTTIERT